MMAMMVSLIIDARHAPAYRLRGGGCCSYSDGHLGAKEKRREVQYHERRLRATTIGMCVSGMCVSNMHQAGQRTSIAPLAAASRRLRGAALGAPSVGMGWGRISLVIVVLLGCGFLAGGENFLLAIVRRYVCPAIAHRNSVPRISAGTTPAPSEWSWYSLRLGRVLPAENRQCSKGSTRFKMGPGGIQCSANAPASAPSPARGSSGVGSRAGLNSPRVAPRRAATGLSAGDGTNLTGSSLLTPGRPATAWTADLEAAPVKRARGLARAPAA